VLNDVVSATINRYLESDHNRFSRNILPVVTDCHTIAQSSQRSVVVTKFDTIGTSHVFTTYCANIQCTNDIIIGSNQLKLTGSVIYSLLDKHFHVIALSRLVFNVNSVKLHDMG